MSQPSIANYFASRKRAAAEDSNVIRAKKVLLLDPKSEPTSQKTKNIEEMQVLTRDIIYSNSAKKELIMTHEKSAVSSQKTIKFPQRNKVITKLDFDTDLSTKRGRPKHKKLNSQPDIQKVLQNMKSKSENEKPFINETNIQKINEKTPPSSPMNAMDSVTKSELSITEIKTKLTRSARLAELRASVSKFNALSDQLKAAEKKTEAVSQAPSLNKFKSIELEVQLSPKKHTPVKSYLSPLKDASPKKNLFGLRSPVKSPSSSPVKVPAYQRFQHLTSPGKPTLTLPYNYRCLAELFRSIDTVCSILFNRKETITFSKLKPAVQEMLRKNLDEKHFAQIKTVFPDAFHFSCEKMRVFGSRNDKYELIIKPNIEEGSDMNPANLLERRRKLFNVLIEKVKIYHNEFLSSLDPPMVISPDKLTRWHPEFDIEKVPEIEISDIPQPPEEEKLTTGQEVLEKARNLFNCNTRMERALEKLKKVQEERTKAGETSSKMSPISNVLKNVPLSILEQGGLGKISNDKSTSTQTKPAPVSSILKGIPASLLEKVRAKQAAKALDAMTRSSSQEKESVMYSRLPDIARLLRNTYVAEKKGVLALEEVIVKLNNSYRSYLTNAEIEQHLRLISKNVPGWLVFHEIRGTLFVKLSRDGDMKRVMTKLEQLAKEKSGI